MIVNGSVWGLCLYDNLPIIVFFFGVLGVGVGFVVGFGTVGVGIGGDFGIGGIGGC